MKYLVAHPSAKRFSVVKHLIRDMDLGLVRAPGDAISRSVQSEYCHAMRFKWWGSAFLRGELMAIETKLRYGCRTLPLERLVAECPGQIDVFEVNPDNLFPAYDRDAAFETLVPQIGQKYGAWNVLKSSVSFLAFSRWFLRPAVDSALRSGLPDCSQQSVEADQAGGVDPVPNRATRLVLPGHLANSPFYKYRFTLLAG